MNTSSTKYSSKDYYFEIIREGPDYYQLQRWSKNYHHRIGKPEIKEIPFGKTLDELTFYDDK